MKRRPESAIKRGIEIPTTLIAARRPAARKLLCRDPGEKYSARLGYTHDSPHHFKISPSMEWLKKNHPVVISSGLYCLGLGLFLYASFATYMSYDTFWHLKMGQDLLGSGLSPTVDHYSFTHEGQPIGPLPYLFQLLLAVSVSVFGFTTGLQLVKILAFLLFALAIRAFYRQINAPWQIIAITLPFIFLFLLYRFNNIRPDLFDNALAVLALVLYLRASASFSHRNLAAIALLQLFWVNYHAPILGYVIFFGLFLDKAIAILRGTDAAVTWQRWAGWGGALFLTGFVNPEFHHPAFAILEASSDWGELTRELLRTVEIAPNSSLFTFFWVVSGYLIIALILQRQYGLALLCGIFVYRFWVSFHLVSLAGVVIFSLLAFSLTRIDFAKLNERLTSRTTGLLGIFAVAMAVSGIALSVSEAEKVYRSTNSGDLPHDVVAYLKKTYPGGGRIFNRMRDGGYLIYNLSPEFKVYIDGRTNVLYPLDFTRRFAELYSAEKGESIAPEIARYDIDFAIFPLKMGLFHVADSSNSLSVEYVSRNFLLMTEGKDNFPLGSRIMYFPMCWRFGFRTELVREYDLARQLLPADSALTPILGSLIALSQSPTAARFFAEIDPAELSSDYQLRLLAYIALESREPEKAIQYFADIYDKRSLDLLMMVYASLSKEDFSEAEKLLLFSLSESWAMQDKRQFNVDELAIAGSLFEMLKSHRALSAESEHHLALIAQDLRQKAPDLKLPLDNVIPQGNCGNLFSFSVTSAS